MKKIIKFIFLIIGYLSFLIGIANAQKFVVKFIDANKSGTIDFTVTAYNSADQTYYTGVATTDHKTIYDPLLKICAGKDNSTNVSWEVSSGGSLIYDIYLTSDPDNINTYYWTSQGDAVGSSTGATLSIDWFSGNSKIAVFNFNFSSSGDSFQIVPLPSALWLLGSGVIALGLIRKKLLSC